MKNFDVELAKKGWPVVTRNDHDVRIVCFDYKEANGTKLIGIVRHGCYENLFLYTEDGHCCYEEDDRLDLFLTDTWKGYDENGDPIGCGQKQKASMLSKQVGGDHYTKRAIQPWEYIEANGLDFFEGNVVKYVTRYKDKDGVKDLRKAKHYIEYLIEREGKK